MYVASPCAAGIRNPSHERLGGASCRSSNVRNAPLATVGPTKAACRYGAISGLSHCRIVGIAVGDTKLELEGKADKIEGRVQNAIGGLKDTLKGK